MKQVKNSVMTFKVITKWIMAIICLLYKLCLIFKRREDKRTIQNIT